MHLGRYLKNHGYAYTYRAEHLRRKQKITEHRRMEEGDSMVKKKRLTPKQELFVSEYLKTGNAAEAVRKAGYKCKNANVASSQGARMLTNVDIARAIEERRAKRSKRLELEEDFELKKALELLQMCMEPEHIYNFNGSKKVDSEGNYVMAFDSKGANSALLLIAKLRGKIDKKIQVSFADDLSSQLERIPDES